jgi:hypothetical protein
METAYAGHLLPAETILIFNSARAIMMISFKHHHQKLKALSSWCPGNEILMF